jgi:hypothetical protein
MKDQEFLWEKLVGVIEENTLLKEKNTRLTKERDEAFARWENLNKDIKDRIGIVRVERGYDPAKFSEHLRVAIDYDPYLWRSSNFDFELEFAKKMMETLRHEINKHMGKSL